MDLLATLAGPIQGELWAAFVVFLRVGAMAAVLPAFGEQSVPMRVKLGAAIAFTLVVTPAMEGRISSLPETFAMTIRYLAPEVVTGLFFGLMLRFLVFSLQIAGSIIAQSTSLSQIFGGSAGADPQPAIGHLLLVAGLALAAGTGLHVQFAAYILQSYTLLPAGVLAGSDVVSDLGTTAVAQAFSLGFVLAAPFMIASLLYNVMLGVINKAMPQLMVTFIGAPAITAGGLMLLLVTAPVLLSVWLSAFAGSVEMPFGNAP
jgi:flagellar biosynthetic protein FliR